MKSEDPYWYTLIKVLKSKAIIKTGLTIPYVFGAYEILGRPFENMNELLSTLLNSKTDKYPVIQKCNYILQHVIMFEDKIACNKGYKKDIRFENATGENVLFISTNTNLGKTLNRVSWNLTAQYDTWIKNKEFSWNQKNKQWQKFTLEEIDIIKSIK